MNGFMAVWFAGCTILAMRHECCTPLAGLCSKCSVIFGCNMLIIRHHCFFWYINIWFHQKKMVLLCKDMHFFSKNPKYFRVFFCNDIAVGTKRQYLTSSVETSNLSFSSISLPLSLYVISIMFLPLL